MNSCLSTTLTVLFFGAAITLLMVDGVAMATKGSSTRYVSTKAGLKAVRQIEAERANFSFGCSQTTETINGVKITYVDGIDDGDFLGYYKMNFTTEGLNGVEIGYECCDNSSDSGLVHFIAKSIDNPPFVTFTIQSTFGNFLTLNQVSNTALTGIQDVYIKFEAGDVTNNDSYYVTKLDYFAFY